MWLVDTGCGHDLISKTVAAQRSRYIRKDGAPIRFSTANGTTNLTTTILPLSLKELGEVIEPYILDSTPPVITVGRRCMHNGYTFIWPSGTPPFFITPNFDVLELEVVGDIPYLRTGAQQCQPRPIDKSEHLRLRQDGNKMVFDIIPTEPAVPARQETGRARCVSCGACCHVPATPVVEGGATGSGDGSGAHGEVEIEAHDDAKKDGVVEPDNEGKRKRCSDPQSDEHLRLTNRATPNAKFVLPRCATK